METKSKSEVSKAITSLGKDAENTIRKANPNGKERGNSEI